MNSRSLFRAAAACAVISASIATPAHAQLGGLRRAAQRAVSAGAANPATQQANSATQQPEPAQSRIGGNVLELTAPVLDRFQRALAAEAADRAESARKLAAVKTEQQYMACVGEWAQTPAGQAEYRKLTAASESGDVNAIGAAGNAIKAAMERACGPDANARSQMEHEAPAHAEAAGIAAGEFTARQYDIVKERVVPFCRAAAQAAADGDVRLPGSGSNVFWVYTAAEAAALRERCGTLMQALANNS